MSKTNDEIRNEIKALLHDVIFDAKKSESFQEEANDLENYTDSCFELFQIYSTQCWDLYQNYMNKSQPCAGDLSDEEIDKGLTKLLKETPVKLVSYLLLVIGRDLKSGNAAETDIKQEFTLGDERCRIEANFKIISLNPDESQPKEQPVKDDIIECPSCGKDWNTTLNKSCYCGAEIRKKEPKELEDKPKVVCFCGSTRFAEWFMIKRWELEKQGIITFGINILPNNYFAEGNSHGAEQEGVKEILDELHKRKIDLSDEVYVLNVDGYIGESTRAEINYAESIGKPIIYLEN